LIIPVILCGGSGTRLWPLSRASYPKQLLPLLHNKSLMQHTLLRSQAIAGTEPPIIICNEDYRFIVAEQLREIGIDQYKIILEPEGRNTAPAITLAAIYALSIADDPYLLVLPADHVINNTHLFAEDVLQAISLAKQDCLVTFGITPNKPETAYGYIQKGTAIANVKAAYTVARFVEKPDLVRAHEYVNSKQYLWNCGMFVFKAQVYLQELQLHAPDILQVCHATMAEMVVDPDFLRVKPAIFNTCRNESIDYAVLEKTDNIAVITLHADWSDVGSWNALCDIHDLDQNGNVVKGDVVTNNVSNSYLHAESRLLAAIGVKDLAIIETADAVLVTHKDFSQDVKAVVNSLRSNNRSEVARHSREYRPWGYYETLNSGAQYHVKHLRVKPGGKLSLQSHQFRSEHWVVISGIATVTRGQEYFDLRQNQSIFIPATIKHRLENLTAEPLDIIEVQTGVYFGEDDIKRYDDIYNRTA
jgi:mannose-1-phosphate guanylyltransferase/mannose-6-phosphate isomerase